VTPAVVLGDAGYWHGEQMDQITGRSIVVLVPTDGAGRRGDRPGWNSGRYGFMRRVLGGEIAGEPYRQRQVMIEPVVARHEVQPTHRPLPPPRTPPEGRYAFEDLVASSDAVTSNLRGGQAEKLGLTYAALSKVEVVGEVAVEDAGADLKQEVGSSGGGSNRLAEAAPRRAGFLPRSWLSALAEKSFIWGFVRSRMRLHRSHLSCQQRYARLAIVGSR
jgi:hypothetical protein